MATWLSSKRDPVEIDSPNNSQWGIRTVYLKEKKARIDSMHKTPAILSDEAFSSSQNPPSDKHMFIMCTDTIYDTK